MRSFYLFIFVLFFSLPLEAKSAKEPCGLEDSTTWERISDCDELREGGSPPVAVVNRTEEGHEILLEGLEEYRRTDVRRAKKTRTYRLEGRRKYDRLAKKMGIYRYLWGPRLEKPMTLAEAKAACAERNRPEHGTLDFLDWRLPQKKDFHPIRDYKDGGNDLYAHFDPFFSIYLGKGSWLWTSSLADGVFGETHFQRFDVVGGGFGSAHKGKESAVRCVFSFQGDLPLRPPEEDLIADLESES